jgi:SAM-dependent methyltransferase
VLEIGCGAGTDLCEFARAGAHVTAVDITAAAIDLTGRRLAAEGLSGRVLHYDGRQFPFDPGSFDLVYSFGVLHHTPFVDDLLAGIHRVLAPHGELKMMVYHRYSLLYHFSILYLRQWKQERGTISREDALSRYSEFRSGCPYTRVLSPGEVRDRLWFFDRVESSIDYCVYDDLNERKLPVGGVLDVEPTGVADIDLFFDDFNEAVRTGRDLRPYGWHLLVRAVRGPDRVPVA